MDHDEELADELADDKRCSASLCCFTLLTCPYGTVCMELSVFEQLMNAAPNTCMLLPAASDDSDTDCWIFCDMGVEDE